MRRILLGTDVRGRSAVLIFASVLKRLNLFASEAFYEVHLTYHVL